jgi:glutathione S-transferase
MPAKPILYHIPVCPFSQRLEILLHLKGQSDAVEFRTVDITRPRDPELLRKTRGTTALPVLELPDGRILKESLVLLGYFEDVLPSPLRRADPYEHAIEQLLISREGPFTNAGYSFVMNQDTAARQGFADRMLQRYAELDDFLTQHNPDGTFLFDQFGLAEVVFTPMFMRFWFLDHYEGFALPQDGRFDRVARWQVACLAHPAAQQVTREEIVKLYYDYAFGAGNGALLPGRTRSSFVFDPPWQDRPMPPKGKARAASDAELGLV